MLRRTSPYSDALRLQALETCRQKALGTAVGQRLITEEQLAAVEGALPGWRQVCGLAGKALARQNAARQACDAAFDEAATAAVHFIHVLNLAIRRGRLAPGVRPGYGLPASRSRVPRLNTTAEVLLWADRLAAGEAARVAAGGAPLAWPDIGEVTDAAAALRACEAALSTAKDGYDDAQAAVAAQRAGVQDIILDVWDTLEFHLRKHDAPSRRRVAREWGVLYTTRPPNKRPPHNGGEVE